MTDSQTAELAALQARLADLRARAEALDVRRATLEVRVLHVAAADGTVRFRIHNQERCPQPQFAGEVMNMGPRPGAGVMFYSQEGTETGGFQGAPHPFFTMDQYQQDQTILAGVTTRSAEFGIIDRGQRSLLPVVRRLQRAGRAGRTRRLMSTAAVVATFAADVLRGRGVARRLSVGATPGGAVGLTLRSRRGRRRHSVRVDASGAITVHRPLGRS